MIGKKRAADRESYDGDDEGAVFELKRFKLNTDEHKGQLVPGVWLPGWDYQLRSQERLIDKLQTELTQNRKELKKLKSDNYHLRVDCHSAKGFEKMAKFECNDMKVKNK